MQGSLLLIVNILILMIILVNYFELGLSIEFLYFVGFLCWFLQTIASYFLATASQSHNKSVNKSVNMEIEKFERRRKYKN